MPRPADYQKGVDLIRDNYDWLMSGGYGLAPWLLWVSRMACLVTALPRPCVWFGLLCAVDTAHLQAYPASAHGSVHAACPSNACAEGVQLVMLGSGREDLENDLRWAAAVVVFGQGDLLLSCWPTAPERGRQRAT